MSVTILNTSSYDGHKAQIAAAVDLAMQNGWDSADGQSASMQNLVSVPAKDASVKSAPKPSAPDLDLE